MISWRFIQMMCVWRWLIGAHCWRPWKWSRPSTRWDVCWWPSSPECGGHQVCDTGLSKSLRWRSQLNPNDMFDNCHQVCIYIYIYNYIYIYIFIQLFTCIYVNIYIYIYVNTHIYVNIYIYMLTHTHIYIYIYTVRYVYVYVYVHVYMYDSGLRMMI